MLFDALDRVPEAAEVAVETATAPPLDEMGLGDWGRALLEDGGLFFHGWNPLPTAASASGGGDLLESLLHCAASIASGVPRRLGCSCMCGGAREKSERACISICFATGRV